MVTDFPDLDQGAGHFAGVSLRSASPFSPLLLRTVIQQANGVFTMIAGSGYKLVQNTALLSAFGSSVAWPDSAHQFSNAIWGHRYLLALGNTFFEAPIPARVRFLMRQFGVLKTQAQCAIMVSDERLYRIVANKKPLVVGTRGNVLPGE
jgi:hypothetical protein